MYISINIFNLIVLIAGITLLSLNYPSQTSIIFGSVLIMLGLLISLISFLVYVYSDDNSVIPNGDPLPVARVIDPATPHTDNVKIIVGIPVDET
jgi:hypothetical protein